MKLLDLFCGLGGVSDGFAKEGFEVLGVDIEDMKSKGYKHPFLRADIRELDGKDFQGYDVIWGSPPCREFSQCAVFARERAKRGQKGVWKKPPNIDNGLELVYAYLAFVKQATPKFWIMENVPNLAKYVGQPIIEKSPIGKTMKRSFWGDFPFFLMPTDLSKPSIFKHNWNHKLRKWQRAKIPLTCSRAFARACKQKLVEVCHV